MVPLLGVAAALMLGVGASQEYVQKVRLVDRWLRPIAAIVLILAGLNDTLTYWFL